MRKIWIVTLSLIILTHAANAAVIAGPQCSVQAQIVSADKDFIDIKILKIGNVVSVEGRGECPVKEGRTYSVMNNYHGSIKPGAIIKAGVESIVNMGPDGPITGLAWSPVTYEDGSPIIIKVNGSDVKIDSLSGTDTVR
jgi:hypothetical protein